jgi:Tol biopolymer transport system component
MSRKILTALFVFSLLFLFGCTIAVGQNSTPGTDVVSSTPVKEIPVTWADLHLTGRLVYIYFDSSDFTATPSIRSLDLVTGSVTTLFQVPSGGWVYYLSASPDGKNLVISYIPPADGAAGASQALYVMPSDGSAAPQLLRMPPTPGDQYIQVEWSPDGKYIYYVHINQKIAFEQGQISPVHTLFRISYPDGTEEKVADNAFWPRPSPDASRIIYVSNDPFQKENLLFIANADGSDPREVVFSGSEVPEIKDAPFILPDEQTILFSAPVAGAAYQPNWLDRLTGIQIAKAHSVPSDWWAIPISGGVPTRLTNLQTINLFASLSPDKKHIASLSGVGLFVMDLDGSNLTQLLSDTGIFGVVNWVP